MSELQEKHNRYWVRHLRIIGSLLVIWFLVSFGFGIIFADALDMIRIGGFGLGFWFAQQGSMFVFVMLIFVYVFLSNRLDREFDVDEQ
jgi:putative solute:sodium symporter small subunit